MKTLDTAANPNATTQFQARDSRQNTETGARSQERKATNAASAAQRATEPAKRGRVHGPKRGKR